MMVTSDLGESQQTSPNLSTTVLPSQCACDHWGGGTSSNDGTAGCATDWYQRDIKEYAPLRKVFEKYPEHLRMQSWNDEGCVLCSQVFLLPFIAREADPAYRDRRRSARE